MDKTIDTYVGWPFPEITDKKELPLLNTKYLICENFT